jgi:hypothetical protein
LFLGQRGDHIADEIEITSGVQSIRFNAADAETTLSGGAVDATDGAVQSARTRDIASAVTVSIGATTKLQVFKIFVQTLFKGFGAVTMECYFKLERVDSL